MNLFNEFHRMEYYSPMRFKADYLNQAHRSFSKAFLWLDGNDKWQPFGLVESS